MLAADPKIVALMGDGNSHYTVHSDMTDTTITHVAAPAHHLTLVPEDKPADQVTTVAPSTITAQFVQQLLTVTRDLVKDRLRRSMPRARGSDAGDNSQDEGADRDRYMSHAAYTRLAAHATTIVRLQV
jgi:hypothetical protein